MAVMWWMPSSRIADKVSHPDVAHQRLVAAVLARDARTRLVPLLAALREHQPAGPESAPPRSRERLRPVLVASEIRGDGVQPLRERRAAGEHAAEQRARADPGLGQRAADEVARVLGDPGELLERLREARALLGR